jgi:RNA polymerase sigma-70 factor (ECF subfamily)
MAMVRVEPLYHELYRGSASTSSASDMRSFEDSLRDELPVLFRVAKRLTRSEQEAEDLVGQTLLSACRAQKSFDGRHLRSWLIRIQRNEFNSNLRRASSRPELILEEIEGASETLWDEVAWRVDAETLLEELQQMSEDQQMIIQLCDVEELTYEEAAEALEIPVGTVRSRLFRARAKLRDRCAGRITVEGATR